MTTVSIVLPAYNAERTIARAIAAVRAQTFGNWELIICDDGSTDNTASIAVESFGGDERITLASRNHAGVSYARNVGLSIAQGTYVVFLDSDDVPEPTWLQTMIDQLGDADLSVTGYRIIDEGGAPIRDTMLIEGWEASRTIAADDFTVSLFSNDLLYQGYIWNKLFRRELVEQGEPLRFVRGIAYNEDRLFLYEYLRRCRSVSFGGRVEYTYTQHPGPSEYSAVQATEITAFDAMIESLHQRLDCEQKMQQALHYAYKDCFRAAATLFLAAKEAGDADALWLGELTCKLSAHRDEFEAWGPEFCAMLAKAVELAERQKDAVA